MDARVEIYVYSGATTGNTTSVGVLELFGTEQIQLVYTIDDIKELGKTRSEFSQTFTVPGDRGNNLNIFKDYFLITNDTIFDPRKKVQCDILVDSIPVLRNAVMQLMSVSINENKVPMYEVQIFGSTSDFITDIGESKIGDLDFSDLSHIWSITSVTNSWTGATAGPDLGYFYPWTDYGYNYGNEDLRGVNYLNSQTNGYGVSYNQMFPATYAKTIVDYIFSGFNRTFDSTFLNSTAFTSVAHIFNSSKDFKLDADYIAVRKAEATASSVQYTVPVVAANTFINLDTGYFVMPFPNETADPSGLYNNATYVYTSNNTQSLKVVVNLEAALTYFSVTANKMNQFTVAPTITAYLHRSSYQAGAPAVAAVSKTYPTYDASVSSAVWTTYTFDFPELDKPLDQQLYPAQPGETFWVIVRATGQGINYIGAGGTTSVSNWIHISTNSNISYSPTSKLVGGQLIDYNYFVPGRNEKIVDYLKSLQTCYNLMFIPDKNNPRNIRIEPRDIVYQTGTTKNWTDKVDHLKPIIETPLAEFQAKSYIFSHKSDSDFLNKNYQDTMGGRIYGDAIVSTESEFLKSENKKTTIFSPTPFTFADDIPTISDNIIFFPTTKIFKVNSNNQFEKTECGFRIGYVKNLPISGGGGTVKFLMNGTEYKTFPYFGQFNDPGFVGLGGPGWTTSTRNMLNINFDETEFMYSIPAQYVGDSRFSATTESLYDKYWAKTINELTDKNARFIKCWIHLSPQDINELEYTDRIYLFGLTPESGEYYRINKITYNAGSNDSSEVELIKIKDLTTPVSVKKWMGFTANGVSADGGGSNTNNGSSFIYGGGVGNALYGPGNETNSSYNFMAGGANVSSGPFNSTIGESNNIGAKSSNNSVNGSGNTLYESVTYSTAIGQNNSIGETTTSAFIVGSNNIIEDSNYSAQTQNAFIVGSNNYINSGTTGVTIFGSNVTGDTSNTLYADNAVIGGAVFSGGVQNFCSGINTNRLASCSSTLLIGDGGGFNDIKFIDSVNATAITITQSTLNLLPQNTLPTSNYGVMFFSGTPLNRIMYCTGTTNADWIII